jgi:hypothetical protein
MKNWTADSANFTPNGMDVVQRSQYNKKSGTGDHAQMQS